MANVHDIRKNFLFFKAIRKEAQDLKSIHTALRYSNEGNRGLPIFSYDLPPKSPTDEGLKGFVVASYQSFWEEYRKLLPKNRCFYDIVLDNFPCKLYIDVDVNLTVNKITPAEFDDLKTRFFDECFKLLMELKLIEKPSDVEIVTLDSSNEVKISKHFVFANLYFKNNFHCGAFMRRLRNQILENYGFDMPANPFFQKAQVKDRDNKGKMKVVDQFFADLAVYTLRRNFRLFKSSKKKFSGPLRFLVKEGDRANPNEPIDSKTFFDCLLQFVNVENPRVVECLESNGTEPISTSKQDYLVPEQFSNLFERYVSDDKATMLDFYKETYPFEFIYQVFGRPEREFCFEYTTGKFQMQRYLFFPDAKRFKSYTMKQLPSVIHIGPVYKKPQRGSEIHFRELVFDVDLNSYGPLRRCCGHEKRACKLCWDHFALFGIKVLTAFLKDYGFKKFAFFFSGSKGFHCWVFDGAAAKLSELARRTLVNDLRIEEISKGDESVINLAKRSYVQKVLNEKDKSFYEGIINQSSHLQEVYTAKTIQWNNVESALCHIFWPRLDMDVTTQNNHLVKSPFMMHKTSGELSYYLSDPFQENPFKAKIDRMHHISKNVGNLHNHLFNQ